MTVISNYKKFTVMGYCQLTLDQKHRIVQFLRVVLVLGLFCVAAIRFMHEFNTKEHAHLCGDLCSRICKRLLNLKDIEDKAE